MFTHLTSVPLDTKVTQSLFCHHCLSLRAYVELCKNTYRIWFNNPVSAFLVSTHFKAPKVNLILFIVLHCPRLRFVDLHLEMPKNTLLGWWKCTSWVCHFSSLCWHSWVMASSFITSILTKTCSAKEYLTRSCRLQSSLERMVKLFCLLHCSIIFKITGQML